MDNDRLLQTTLAKMYNYFTHTKKQILVTMLNTVEDNYQRYWQGQPWVSSNVEFPQISLTVHGNLCTIYICCA